MNRRNKENSCLKDLEYIREVFKETGWLRTLLSKYRLRNFKENFLHWAVLLPLSLSAALVLYFYKDGIIGNVAFYIALVFYGLNICLFIWVDSREYKDEYIQFGIKNYSIPKKNEYLHYVHFRKKVISDGKFDQEGLRRLVNWITAEDNSKFSSVYESPLFLTALGGFITLIATSLAIIEIDSKNLIYILIIAFVLSLIFLPFVDVLRISKNKPLRIRKFLEWLILDYQNNAENFLGRNRSAVEEIEFESAIETPTTAPDAVKGSNFSPQSEEPSTSEKLNITRSKETSE